MSGRPFRGCGLVVGLLLATTGGDRAETPEELYALYERAFEEAGKGNFEAAVTGLEKFQEARPDIPEPYRNLGEWYLGTGHPARALEAWKEYRRLAPEDWRWREGFIQAYQALGDTALRDQERLDLLRERGSSADPEVRKLRHFRRERFRVGGRRVIAYELFEAEAEGGIIYEFNVPLYDGENNLLYYWASPDEGVRMARELGLLEEGKRPYSLDYVISSEKRMGKRGLLEDLQFQDPPQYEFVRGLVVKKLADPPGPPLSKTVFEYHPAPPR